MPGEGLGFKHVESGPLVRSSFHAFDQAEAAVRQGHPLRLGATGQSPVFFSILTLLFL